MVSVKCPKCKQTLLRLPVNVDGVKKESWLHPDNPLIRCDYAQDGTRVTIEVIDSFLFSKFQELMENDGIRDNWWWRLTNGHKER